MICPKCGQDTPIQKTFCIHCGGLVEMSMGDVQEVVEAEAGLDAQRHFVRKMGTWLATSLVLFAAAVAFRMGNREKDLPRFDEPPVLQILDLEPLPPFPAVDLPPLTLDVPAS